MRIIFMGSAEFACPAVEALLGSRHVLAACVTQPDRPKGRHLQLTPCPVKALAVARGVPVLTPEKVGEASAELAALQPDLIAVAAYGQYIPSAISERPRHRAINIHPSLLPQYRGAAPIQWAVANGDAMTGVSIQYVARRMDAGDLLLQQEFAIAEDDTAATLEPRLARAGAELLLRAVDLLETGHVHATPQDESRVSLARKLVKADAAMDWQLPARALRNRVRGFQPWPGACFTFEGRTVKVLQVAVEEGGGAPGRVLDVEGAGPLVACGEGALRLLSLQPEGKRAMAGSDFVHGTRLRPGAHFRQFT
jgi:methionyl-tRNA formyltransferase